MSSEKPDTDSGPLRLVNIPFRMGSQHALIPIMLPGIYWENYVTTGTLHPKIQEMVDEQIACLGGTARGRG